MHATTFNQVLLLLLVLIIYLCFEVHIVIVNIILNFVFFIIIIEAQRDRMVVDLQLPMQSVTITTNVVSWNPAHGEVYLIQHHVINFVSDFR